MSNKPLVSPVPAELLSRAWLAAGAIIMRGLAKATDVTIRQVVDGLVKGEDQLWLVVDEGALKAAFLTAVFVDEERHGTFLGVYGLAGDGLDGWARPLSDAVTKHARAKGCDWVRFSGRPGWARVLPEYVATDNARNGETVFERAI